LTDTISIFTTAAEEIALKNMAVGFGCGMTYTWTCTREIPLWTEN
jgi:hypothetical protein